MVNAGTRISVEDALRLWKCHKCVAWANMDTLPIGYGLCDKLSGSNLILLRRYDFDGEGRAIGCVFPDAPHKLTHKDFGCPMFVKEAKS